MSSHEEMHLPDYEEEETPIIATTTTTLAADAAAGTEALATGTEGDKKGTHVSIHSESFKDFLLDNRLFRAIQEAGFEHPSEVQHQAIVQAYQGSDILCQALSGMGKTAVFVISTIQRLSLAEADLSKDHVAVLVLAHTRELAYQIKMEYDRFVKYFPFKVAVFFGGDAIQNNIKTLKEEKPTIVVSTPGRMFDLVNRGEIDLSQLKVFVIDECDSVLSGTDMRTHVQRIFVKTPREKQTMMFTATLPDEMKTICKRFMNHPLEIYVDKESKLTLAGLRQYYVSVLDQQKVERLMGLLDHLDFSQVVIFVRSIARCKMLAELLANENFPAIAIYSTLDTQERIARYRRFKENKERILVATDLFGRGIDIEHVNIVINFDLPESSDQYLHRVGRAGRFGTKGLAIAFCDNKKEEVDLLESIQNRFEVDIEELPDHIDPSTYMVA